MNAMLTTIRSEIRGRVLQTVVIAFVILLSSGAATLALNLLVESDAPYEHAFQEANGAHLIITYAAHGVTAAGVATTASAPGVTASSGPWPEVVVPYTSGPNGAGDTRAGMLFIVGRNRPNTIVDRLTMESGRWAHGQGEVVISRNLADSWGLGVGDSLTPQSGSDLPVLHVTGIAASISPYTDAWVPPQQVLALAGRQTPLQYQMLYRVHPADTEGELRAATQAIASRLPANAVVHTNTYLEVKRSADLLSSVMVPFLLAFSAFAMLASILIIMNVVGGIVISGYRDIGIFKSIGFTPGGVVAVLLGIVLLPAFAGCLIGIPLGTLGSQPFLHQTAHALGLPAPFTAAVPVDGLTLLVVLLVAGLAAFGPAWRAGHLSAVTAITMGSAPAAGRTSRLETAVSGLPLPRTVTLGLATILSRPLRSAMTLGSIVLGVATAVFALSLHLSLGLVAAHLIRDRYVQVEIYRPSPDMVKGAMKPGFGAAPVPPQISDARMTRVLRSDLNTAHFAAETSAPITIPGIAEPVQYYGYREASAWIGFALISGRWFSGPGEVVAPTKVFTEAHLRLGDRLVAHIRGKAVQLRLVGEILDQQDNNLLLRGGWGALKTAIPRLQPTMYEIQVRTGLDPHQYLDELAVRLGVGQLGGLDASITEQSSTNTSFVLLNGVIAALAVVLISIAIAGVFNTVLLMTRERVRDVAILKAVGMAPGQVVAMVLLSVVALGVVAGIAGIPLGLVLHAQVITLMAQIASGSNLPPAFLDPIDSGVLPLLALAGAGIAAVGAWAPAQWAARSGVASVLQSE